MEVQLSIFDYSSLDAETRIVVQQEDKKFDRNIGEAGTNFIRACHNLKRIHDALNYHRPGFEDYCSTKSGLRKSTAYRMIDVAKMFPESGNIGIASKEALYLLAAPSTPDYVRDAIVEEVQNGEKFSFTDVKEIIRDSKTAAEYPKISDLDECEEEYLDSCHNCKFLQTSSDIWWCTKLGRTTYIDYTVCDMEEWVSENEPENKPHVANNSGNNEWYTPPEYIKAARAVMGDIDLDPASSEIANRTVGAHTFYDEHSNGLSRNWAGRVWMNPPYAAELIGKFCEKLAGHYIDGSISEAVVLVNNATETGWFNQLIGVADAVVFTKGRIKFIDLDGNRNGAPLQGQAVIYMGPNPDEFIVEFSAFGWGAKIWRQ